MAATPEADTIAPLDEFSGATGERLRAEIDAIFWETASTTDFPTPAERHAFWWRYFGYYIDHAPNLTVVARDGETGAALGYVCGVADTRAHRELYAIAAHVSLFDDCYDRYPAHLHINLTAAARGRGLGGHLLRAIESRVVAAGADGIHLVTSVGARNVTFYRRNGYLDAVQRAVGDDALELLLLGKRLGRR